jgi:hypothetical protein
VAANIRNAHWKTAEGVFGNPNTAYKADHFIMDLKASTNKIAPERIAEMKSSHIKMGLQHS